MPELTSAATVGPVALSWLTQAQSPEVLHIFDGACNLYDGQAGVLSVVTWELGPGPFNVQLAAQSLGGLQSSFASLSGSSYAVGIELDVLTLGTLVIDCGRAAVWHPVPDWPAVRRAEWGTNLPILRAAMPPGASGLSGLLDDMHDSRLLRLGRRGWFMLRRGLVNADSGACARGGAMLAGLGPGLTPSGDDFLVGVIYALWATQPERMASALAQATISGALARTGKLSAAWLRAASEGQTAAAWRDMLNAAGLGASASLLGAAQDILSTGETSGADALAGFLAAMAVLGA